ncbi:transglutaminase domain-containing protein [Cellulomonas sp. zg-ZUI222]|uniref:Transglutaminase domain-containing protein n=1 Tax=Cellulomonas wangleii TaxID=2816956 RepID=A0ABX8D0S0_9CELL|nr:transglutaminase-like domain-containing protein [Cellulomonas wangleii]MBO0921083.1 transglutaminase domain-containing protein [Cellulomonas wangleii]MBO0925436.1 transglutaminase domain-containing protein [Cellulomonas wangleii]QVI61086.1 transglutaminase domain-containing protein [Cellulomonas wangleii]
MRPGQRIGVREPADAVRDVLVLTVATALALTPLLPAYGSSAVLPALVGGVVLGATVTVVGALRRWSAVVVVAALVGAYALAGGALAAPTTTVGGVVPTPTTVLALARGAASTWKQVLTLQPPVGAGGTLLVAAYLLALVGTAAALALTLRVRRPAVAALAALVPVLVLVGAIVLGTRQPPVPPAVAGTALAVLGLTWASWRTGRWRPRRVVATGALAAVALTGGLLGGPLVVADEPRVVVRDEIVPPFDPRDYPSPLAAFRRLVKLDETVLLTVDGLPEGARVRLATFDRYDGVVFNVAGDGTAQASGEFRRVGDRIEVPVDGERARVEVTVGALQGVWLPTVGYAAAIDLGRATGDLRYNDATGGAVVTSGLREGMTYALDVVVPPVPGADDIGDAGAGPVVQPASRDVQAVSVAATDIARDAGTAVQITEAIAVHLAEQGYFSHGITDAGDHPSLSGHGAARLADLVAGDLMVGDGEQYAAAAALMIHEMGLPARVVLGFVPGSGDDDGEGVAPTDEDGAVEIRGRDVQAWVEVAFAGHGWVPFDVTPPRSRTPEQEQEETDTDPQPQVVQPPALPPDRVTPPDDDTEQPQTEDPAQDDSGLAVWLRVAAWVGIGLGGVLLLLSPVLVVLALKWRRRRRRRRAADPVRRVAGGWDEVVDAARDMGGAPPPAATRREAARAWALSLMAGHPAVAARVEALARRADRAVFAAGTPERSEIEAYWADVDAAVAELRRTLPWRGRVRSQASLASLRAAGGRQSRGPRTPRGVDGRPAEVPAGGRGAGGRASAPPGTTRRATRHGRSRRTRRARGER